LIPGLFKSLRLRIEMIWRYASLSIALACSWGCAGTGISPICNPGSAPYQQAQAERFDPYPLPDVAPDTGARPLAYIQPATEAQRAQDAGSFQQRFGQAPPPGMYKPPGGSHSVQQIPYISPVLPPPPQAAPVFAP
jgi:hypothetical protein